MEQSDDFASSMITLDDGRVITKCDQCREMWRERNFRGVEGSPPCETCRVDLDRENQDAATVYQIVRGQVRTRHNGRYDEIIDLDYTAVKIVMDLYGINDQRSCLEKVRKAFYHFTNKGREES